MQVIHRVQTILVFVTLAMLAAIPLLLAARAIASGVNADIGEFLTMLLIAAGSAFVGAAGVTVFKAWQFRHRRCHSCGGWLSDTRPTCPVCDATVRHCLHCGYVLAEPISARCPECGVLTVIGAMQGLGARA